MSWPSARRARARVDDAADDADQRRLAGAVRAEQREDLATPDRQVDVPQRQEATRVRLAHAGHGHDRRCRIRHRPLCYVARRMRRVETVDHRCATCVGVAASHAVETDAIDPTATRATHAPNTMSRTRVLRWRVAMLSRRLFEVVMPGATSWMVPVGTRWIPRACTLRLDGCPVARVSRFVPQSRCRSVSSPGNATPTGGSARWLASRLISWRCLGFGRAFTRW